MKSSDAKIDEALLDVRRAYRLLHDYQRMALDAANYIGKQLGMTYAGGWPLFSDPSPRNGQGKLNYWSWDWLNLVFYEFHFSKAHPDNKTLRLAILLISDTGCFSSGEEPKGEPAGSDFAPPEQSKTKVGFLISAGEWPPAFKANNAGMKAFTDTDGDVPADDQAKGIFGRCWDFARLASEEETLLLIEELVVFANHHGVPLQQIDQKA